MTRRLVVTDHAFKNLDHEQAAAAATGASFEAFQCVSEEETASAVRGADAVITNFAPITEAVLSNMNQGGAVIRYGIGYDNVDIDAATRLGIAVANVPDYGISAVADHAAASILALLRQLPTYTDMIRTKGWAKPGDVGQLPALGSLTVGFVGYGRIARALRDRLEPFGFSFIAFDPLVAGGDLTESDPKMLDLEELARRSHVISLHAPSTPETVGIIDRAFLAKLPTGSIVVNTARGQLVDLEALAEALHTGHLRGAALDVTNPEPLPGDSPLRKMSNVLLSPHAAFYDEESLDRLQQLASDEAERALRGQPLNNVVNG